MFDRLLEFNDSSIPTITLVNMLAKVFEERVSEITDDELASQYRKYMNNLRNQATTSSAK